MPKSGVPRKGSVKILQPFHSAITFGPGGKGKMGHGDQSARGRVGDAALASAKAAAEKQARERRENEAKYRASLKKK